MHWLAGLTLSAQPVALGRRSPTQTHLLVYEATSSQSEVRMLGAGDSVPSFTLRSHDGESISLDELKGSWVVLHSFPFAFTGG